jgi:hypothetical protein
MAVISATRIQLPQYRESCSAIAYPYSSVGARKWWSSYHVEVAQTGCDREVALFDTKEIFAVGVDTAPA